MARKTKTASIKGIGILRLVILFVLLTLGGMSMFFSNTEEEVSLLSSFKKEKATVYPRLYSDQHITSNAIIADPRFKSLAIFDKSGLLANTISSITKNPSNIDTAYEKGTWLWTPTLDITPKYRDHIIAGAKKNGINVIYLSIDSYLDIYVLPDGEEKQKKRKAFDAVVEDFISTALKNGISVDAESGWRNWAEGGNSYKAFAILNYVKTYNKNHKSKFRGFQYDIEPYLLESYQKNKEEVLTDFLDLVGETISRLNNTDLRFSVVIPEFYDGTNSETPSFTYLGKKGFAIDHLVTIMKRRPQSSIIVMSYRNISKGDDGSIEITEDEIRVANPSGVKIIVAQETGDVLPPYITFHKTSRKHLDRQITAIEKAFAIERSFGGVAIHYVNAFMDLK